MIALLNGNFVPEDQATVSVFDRSFLYGDGLFETIRISNGNPFRWREHIQRLQGGADFLGIVLPYDHDRLAQFAAELVRRNNAREALLRLTLSRGVGLRGYSPKGAEQPTLVMTIWPMPPGGAPQPVWKLATASVRLPAGDKLAQFKTCNKLAQVLARAEAEAKGADEALLVNTDGYIVEAASANLFWVRDGQVETAPLAAGILAGVTRSVVRELSQAQGLGCAEVPVRPEELLNMDGVFLSLSSLGLVPVTSLDGHTVRTTPLVESLRAAYEAVLQQETAAASELAVS